MNTNIFQPTNQIPMTKYEAERNNEKYRKKKQSQSTETTGNTQKTLT